MAGTAERRPRPSARTNPGTPGPDRPRADEDEFERAEADPRTKEFAKAAKGYWRKVRESGAGD